jgi:hypothetical protein
MIFDESRWENVYVDNTSNTSNWTYTYANDIIKLKKPDDLFDNELFEIEED